MRPCVVIIALNTIELLSPSLRGTKEEDIELIFSDVEVSGGHRRAVAKLL